MADSRSKGAALYTRGDEVRTAQSRVVLSCGDWGTRKWRDAVRQWALVIMWVLRGSGNGRRERGKFAERRVRLSVR